MFTDHLYTIQETIQKSSIAWLDTLPSGDLRNAMAYAIQGGKSLRGFLVIEGARLHGVALTQSLPTAVAVECIHSYSLVHDDLPAVDNDDLRRGRLTIHKKWNEATAILVGDALQTLAFHILSDPVVAPDANVRLTLIASLAQAIGGAGMVYGQAADLAASYVDMLSDASDSSDYEKIEAIQRYKTGALIQWAGAAGAHLAKQNPTALVNYASAVGLAFQIQDDIIDYKGNAEHAGKRVGKDCKAGKATLISYLGLAKAENYARMLIEKAEAAIDVYGDESYTLKQLARFVIERNR